MIHYLDTFVDTRAKRSALFHCIAVILGLLLLMSYLRLTISLINLHTYDDLFALLENEILQNTYLSRVIVTCLSMAQFDLRQFLNIAYSSLRIWECLTMLFLIIWLSEHKERKLRIFTLISSFLVISIIVLCAIQGFHASMVMQAIDAIKTIGYVLLISSLLFALLFAYLLLHSFAPEYYEALQYQAEELT